MDEIWKDIEGYEDDYQVSNLGRVKSLPKKCWNGKGYWFRDGRILIPIKSKKGHNFRMEIILDLTFCFYSRFVNYKSNFPVVSEELKRSSHIKITVYLFVSFRFHFKR